jgi:cytochrome c2
MIDVHFIDLRFESLEERAELRNTTVMLFFIAVALVLLAWPAASAAQIEIIPGSSARGAELFTTKACVQCHAFRGVGGTIAPDLAQPGGRAHTPMQLASALWNHGPRMWRTQEAPQVRPTLESVDAADLFAYFYSLAYFSASGNAAKGAEVFEEKGCSVCHGRTIGSIDATSRSRRPLQSPISTWTRVADPLAWAERMWNHSGKVFKELSQTGSRWPQFSSHDMVDLLAYLLSLPEARSQSAVFQPGDPEQGRITFDRTCASCHSFGGRTAQVKIDLLKRPAPDGLTGYVASMWNHAPIMDSRAGTEFPILGPGDMSNLVAYLFAQRYFYEEGNVDKGARLFQTKTCVICHEQQKRQTGAPDLTISTERYSAITMSAAIWRHGPAMNEALDRNKLRWPELNASEMADLITYLNSRLVRRVAH